MRLHVLSDLHLEFAPYAPDPVACDVIVVAGDVHPGLLCIDWLRRNYPSQPVIFVAGNHEFYAEKFTELITRLKEETLGSNIHVLENDFVQISGVTFLGATLWTDFELGGDRVLAEITAATHMADYNCILAGERDGRLGSMDTRHRHQRSRAWLEGQISQLRQSAPEGKLVVVTHHAPSGKSVPPRFHGNPLNGAFASNLDSLVESTQARLWVHGHIHQRADYVLGNTRVLANPRGYPDETDIGFQPDLVIEI